MGAKSGWNNHNVLLCDFNVGNQVRLLVCLVWCCHSIHPIVLWFIALDTNTQFDVHMVYTLYELHCLLSFWAGEVQPLQVN